MPLDPFRIDGKVALVTGGNRGCSPEASYVTGTVLVADGGHTTH